MEFTLYIEVTYRLFDDVLSIVDFNCIRIKRKPPVTIGDQSGPTVNLDLIQLTLILKLSLLS